MSDGSRPQHVDPVAISTLFVRMLGFGLIVLGAWLSIGRGVEWSGGYDAVYLKEFLLAKMVSPLVALVLGIVVWGMSRRLGRWLARDL